MQVVRVYSQRLKPYPPASAISCSPLLPLFRSFIMSKGRGKVAPIRPAQSRQSNSKPFMRYYYNVYDGFIDAPCSGQIIMVLMCSFQKPEFNQPQHYFKMLRSIKQPDELPLDEDVMEQRLKSWTHISDENRAKFKRVIEVRAFKHNGYHLLSVAML